MNLASLAGGNALPDLSPEQYLAMLSSAPTGWVTVDAYHPPDGPDAAVTSHLCEAGDESAALADFGWDSSSLGGAGIEQTTHEGVSATRFFDGLSDDLQYRKTFFVQTRWHHGLGSPNLSIEFDYPFLWYFNAIPTGSPLEGGFNALDDSGEETPLIRWRVQTSSGSFPNYVVQVDGVLLRRYLQARNMVLVVQHDVRYFSEASVEEVHASSREDDHHFSYFASSDHPGTIGHASYARLLGKHLVKSFVGPAAADSPKESESYPTFIIGIDPATGNPVEAASSPKTRTAPYLTPVYFDRTVLQRYVGQPRKYQVSTASLRCLHLWSLQMDVNKAGQVEVYLGDLARDLPASERPHWRAHNVVPAGGMNESRFRRDFLAEFVAADDPVEELRAARTAANDAFAVRYGNGLFAIPTEADAVLFARLTLPLNDESPEFERCTLVLARGLVDALQVQALRSALTGAVKEGAQSLGLLEMLISELGADGAALVRPFHAIQAIRSTGVAHLKGSKFEKVLQKYDLADAPSARAFERLVRDATTTLIELLQLLNEEDPSFAPA